MKIREYKHFNGNDIVEMISQVFILSRKRKWEEFLRIIGFPGGQIKEENLNYFPFNILN